MARMSQPVCGMGCRPLAPPMRYAPTFRPDVLTFMSPRSRPRPQPRWHGIVPVSKPAGLTSHDCVDIVRRIAGQRQVGHAGTLDPSATGVLVLCLGEATRISEYLMAQSKTYTGVMRLGAVSDTQDADGTLQEVEKARRPTEEQLRAATEAFLGDIRQLPPAYSAKKIAGRPAYEYARAGEEVHIEPKVVTVHRYDIVGYRWPEARFEVECGSGTYVRTLVHDLGHDLGCGAYLASLSRTRVGSIGIEDCVGLDALRAAPEGFGDAVWPMERALDFWPHAQVTAQGFPILKRGHAIPAEWAPLTRPLAEGRTLEWLQFVLIVDGHGRAMTIARYLPAPTSPPPRELAEYRGAWLQPVKQLG